MGLMGGSLAIDLKKRGLAERIVAYNRSVHRGMWALEHGVCDAQFNKVIPAVAGSDLVVFATPVGTIPKLAETIAPEISPGTLLTDLGSTKEILVKKLDRIFSPKTPYVGSHPIAGTENSGVESAIPELFEGKWWIFTPTKKSQAHQKALRRLIRLVKALGAKPAQLSPRTHDQHLAAISHLPHVAAYALVHTVLKTKGGEALKYAGRSFGDFTRIAASSPKMWADICMDNRSQLLDMVGRYEKSLARFKVLIDRGDAKGLERLFASMAKVKGGK